MKFIRSIIVSASLVLMIVASSCDEESCVFDIDPWYFGPSSVTITDSHVEYVYNEGYTYYGGPFFNRFSKAKGLDKITSLKISGDMYLQDFEVIQKCTNLVTADFSEARIYNVDYYDYSISFAGLEFLETVILPTNMPDITSDCFQGCINLKSITMQWGVERIEDHAFESLPLLKKVDMSNASTNHIGDSVFCNCSSLKRVILPSSITSIDDYAFAYCTSLEEITLPNWLWYVGFKMFTGCKNLKQVKLSTGIRYISSCMFEWCISLESITIPETVTRILPSPFYKCTKLKHIRLEAKTPPYLYEDAFYGFDQTACTLSVPKSAVETYKNTDGWKDFGTIVGF